MTFSASLALEQAKRAEGATPDFNFGKGTTFSRATQIQLRRGFSP
jgi:hypothetical protein